MRERNGQTTITYVLMIVGLGLTAFMYEEVHQYWLLGLALTIVVVAAHFISLAKDFDALDRDVRKTFDVK